MCGRLTILNAKNAIYGAGVSGYRVMWELQGGRCFHCGHPLVAAAYDEKLNPAGWTREHLMPRARGGKTYGNVVLACRDCNQSKAHRLPKKSQMSIAGVIWAIYGPLMGVPRHW